jgi:hypothetical protein
LRTQPVAGKTQDPGANQREVQAKHVVAKLHAVSQQAAPALVKPAAAAAVPEAVPEPRVAPPIWPKMPRLGQTPLELAIQEAEEQEGNKMKELKVQEGLEKEKEVEALQAQKLAVELRAQATKLRKQAEMAAEIAKEKSDEAAKAENGTKVTEGKVSNILDEEREMQRVLNQTQKEELALEHNISALQAQKALVAPQVKLAPVAKVSTKTSVSAGTKVAASKVIQAGQAMSQEAMQKLMDENSLLKHQKAELEKQLSDRKVAKEKAKLKQKLKNRLALADRHMKLQKHMLRTPH